MIRTNIIRASNWRGDQCRTAPVWQWDYGQILKIEGQDLPTAYEVHFTDSYQPPAIVQIGNADGVSVPDTLLDTGRTIIAYIYLHATDTSGETVKTITIPVNQRASIGNEQPTPEQQTAIEEAIELLNDAVGGVGDAIDEALAEAKASGEFDGADGQPGADGVGVPAGGTAGQVLTKVDGTDYNTAWTAPYTGTVTETVSGTTPTITAQADHRYICGEVSTLDITLPASGCIDVVFVSGSTPTVLTVTPPTGVSLKWANGFDSTALDADTTYEINIADGLGVAGSWT